MDSSRKTVSDLILQNQLSPEDYNFLFPKHEFGYSVSSRKYEVLSWRHYTCIKKAILVMS